MDTQTPKTNTTTAKPAYSPSKGRGSTYSGGASRSGGEHRKPRASFERPKPEFDQKMVSIRRVTRVVSGGRRMSFAVALAIGDKKGSLGLGTGKGNDTALAIAKALRVAKKNMFRIKTTKEMSIPVDVFAKFASSTVAIMPNRGKGLVAGSTVREMLTLAGIKNVTAKINSGSKNKLNNARATYYALYQIRTKGSIKAKPVLAEEVTKE
ncbi:MAG: small subunit ribosomal protein [Patescibacteria group bacterium]|jgi:small subunit ribosomal protein S5|nr:small subunit ribosomal protein [Patescibacteria group bacterium]